MSHPKRPSDPNQLAKSIIGIAAFSSVDSACRRRRSDKRRMREPEKRLR